MKATPSLPKPLPPTLVGSADPVDELHPSNHPARVHPIFSDTHSIEDNCEVILKMSGSNLAYCTAKRTRGVLCYNGSQPIGICLDMFQIKRIQLFNWEVWRDRIFRRPTPLSDFRSQSLSLQQHGALSFGVSFFLLARRKTIHQRLK
jgi:hypothetical protein